MSICKRQFKRRRASTKVCSGVCRIKLATRSNAKWRDPARIREYMRVYGRKHRESRKDELRMKVIARRARIRGNGGTFSLPEWRTLCEAFEGRCVCCLEKPELLTVDHVIPVSKVGRNDIGNIQPLCWPCNHKKRAQAVDYRPLFAIRCAKGYETSEWNLKRQQVLDAFGITIHLI